MAEESNKDQPLLDDVSDDDLAEIFAGDSLAEVEAALIERL